MIRLEDAVITVVTAPLWVPLWLGMELLHHTGREVWEDFLDSIEGDPGLARPVEQGRVA